MRYTLSTDFGALNPNFMVILSSFQWFLLYEHFSFLHNSSTCQKKFKQEFYDVTDFIIVDVPENSSCFKYGLIAVYIKICDNSCLRSNNPKFGKSIFPINEYFVWVVVDWI